MIPCRLKDYEIKRVGEEREANMTTVLRARIDLSLIMTFPERTVKRSPKKINERTKLEK